MMDRDTIHGYWRNPPDAGNAPVAYLDGSGVNRRSRFLVRLMRRFANRSCSVLEVGCSAGRNLTHLHHAGYSVAGVEINAEALTLFNKRTPGVFRHATIYRGCAEDMLPTIPAKSYDVVFTMAVLEHIHDESIISVCDEMTRIAKTIITIEDEHSNGQRHAARNYRNLFEPLGFRQVYECRNWRWHGLTRAFRTRVFAVPGQRV